MADKPIKLEVVTPERIVFSQDVDFVVVPGTEGELGVLPGHAPLVTSVDIGVLKIKSANKEEKLAVSGGFFEVREDKAVLLAITAERPEEIDINRANEAKRRAEQRLANRTSDVDLQRAESALRRAVNRINVIRK